MAEKSKVVIGKSVLTRDLVWCECGRGLSLTGKWIYCPTCGREIDQASYDVALQQAAAFNTIPKSVIDNEKENEILQARAVELVAVIEGIEKALAVIDVKRFVDEFRKCG